MIKKLKAKIISANMLFVILILLTAFLILFFSMKRSYYNDSIDAMKKAVKAPFGFSEQFRFGKNEKRDTDDIIAFYVTINKDGSVGSLIGANITITDNAQFEKMVLSCLSSKKTGVIKKENLRYMVTESKYFGTVVAFADMTNENESISELCKMCLFIGIGMFILFFAVSVLLANWAVKPVKKSIEQQNRFIADASHELKTPLSVILANTDIISSHPDSYVGEQQKWLSYIKTEANSMNELVCDMITLAKNDSERIEKKEFVRVNLSDTVNSAVLPFESVAYECGKELCYEINDGITVNGDTKSLERLAKILLDNAVKYANPGGRINVYLYELQNKVIFTVRNSGEPIEADRLAHIFDRFYRIDDARARETGGFGLGLSIAKDIAEKHKATISVESNERIGTAFTVTFKKQ